MPKALFLCSGTGSVGEPFRKGGWEVVDVDWSSKYNPEIQTDITTWDYKAAFEPGHFDVIWASPDCRMYSMARTTAKTKDFESADKLVKACREIIEYLKPRLYFIENPDTGYLKTRPVVEGLPYVRTDYCMHGCMYRKRTRVWTNCTEWKPKLCDKSHLVDGKHLATAQQGFGRDDRNDRHFTRDELHRLPKALCEDIFDMCNATPPRKS